MRLETAGSTLAAVCVYIQNVSRQKKYSSGSAGCINVKKRNENVGKRRKTSLYSFRAERKRRKKRGAARAAPQHQHQSRLFLSAF